MATSRKITRRKWLSEGNNDSPETIAVKFEDRSDHIFITSLNLYNDLILLDVFRQ